ncbi:hypothetical protein ACWGMA_32280 [Streptomyces asiaticus]
MSHRNARLAVHGRRLPIERVRSDRPIAPSTYPPELRKCAVRMVAEVRGDYPTESAAINAVMVRLGIGSRETLRKWVRQDQIDSGQRPT